MVVLWGCPVLLLGLRRGGRLESWLPLRPGTTAAYVLRSFAGMRSAERCAQLMGMGTCFALHPFILLAVRS